MDIAPIDDPLAWQKMIDLHGIGFNMRGSARLWTTVGELTGLRIWRDGAPEFGEMVIELKEGVGLLLTAESWGVEPDEPDFIGAWLHPRFVELDYKKDYWPVKAESEDKPE